MSDVLGLNSGAAATLNGLTQPGGVNYVLAYDTTNAWLRFFSGSVAGGQRVAFFSDTQAAWPVQTVTGASKTFAAADLGYVTRRSNGGSAMTDTFPAASASTNGNVLTLDNVDASASITISAGAGTTIAGSGTYVHAPGRSVFFVYDGPNTAWRPIHDTGIALLGPNNLSDVASPSAARNALGAAASGGNSDITALTGGTGWSVSGSGVATFNTLTVTNPLSVGNGGTGANTTATALANLGGAPLVSRAFFLAGSATAVNCNATGDTAIAIALPAGITYWRVNSVYIVAETGSFTTAKAGLYTATGAGGQAFFSTAQQPLSGLTTTSVNVAGNILQPALVGQIKLNLGTLYFNVGTAQGGTSTVNVYVIGSSLPNG